MTIGQAFMMGFCVLALVANAFMLRRLFLDGDQKTKEGTDADRDC
jgi:hypothetical protein